jgi:L-ribulokinase
VVLTGGLSQKNDFLMQLMADVLGRELSIPQLVHPTAIGAAIHGAVSASVVANYAEGAQRFGAKEFRTFTPDATAFAVYSEHYRRYRELADNPSIHKVMHELA